MGKGWRAWSGVVVVLLSGAGYQPELRASGKPASIHGLDRSVRPTVSLSGQTASTKADEIQKPPQTRTRSQTLPEALAAAVTLLGWYGDDVPRFELAEERPPDGTPNAEAWVCLNGDGATVPVIYVASNSSVYREALRDYQSLVKLAGILAHERWHLRHGPDESSAYETELATMTYLHANTVQLAEVRRSLNWTRQRVKNRAR